MKAFLLSKDTLGKVALEMIILDRVVYASYSYRIVHLSGGIFSLGLVGGLACCVSNNGFVLFAHCIVRAH